MMLSYRASLVVCLVSVSLSPAVCTESVLPHLHSPQDTWPHYHEHDDYTYHHLSHSHTISPALETLLAQHDQPHHVIAYTKTTVDGLTTHVPYCSQLLSTTTVSETLTNTRTFVELTYVEESEPTTVGSTVLDFQTKTRVQSVTNTKLIVSYAMDHYTKTSTVTSALAAAHESGYISGYLPHHNLLVAQETSYVTETKTLYDTQTSDATFSTTLYQTLTPSASTYSVTSTVFVTEVETLPPVMSLSTTTDIEASIITLYKPNLVSTTTVFELVPETRIWPVTSYLWSTETKTHDVPVTKTLTELSTTTHISKSTAFFMSTTSRVETVYKTETVSSYTTTTETWTSLYTPVSTITSTRYYGSSTRTIVQASSTTLKTVIKPCTKLVHHYSTSYNGWYTAFANNYKK